MFGTAHAVAMLSDPAKHFRDHPYGGVVRVDMDDKLPFARRFDKSTAKWDDEEGYDTDKAKKGLKLLHQDAGTWPDLHITKDEVTKCLEFVESL